MNKLFWEPYRKKLVTRETQIKTCASVDEMAVIRERRGTSSGGGSDSVMATLGLVSISTGDHLGTPGVAGIPPDFD